MTSAEWAAWVSAGAAVVQAISAGLAIWYSSKLAREGVTRELSAAEASRLREEEADNRAAARIAAADDAAKARREEDNRQLHNQPISMVIGLASEAVAALTAEQRRLTKLRNEGVVSPSPIQGQRPSILLERQQEALIDGASTAGAAAAIDAVLTALAPYDRSLYLSPEEWLRVVNPKIEQAEAAIENLRLELWREGETRAAPA